MDAGARIITGSFTKQAVAGPCRYEGDFDVGAAQGLGQVVMEYV